MTHPYVHKRNESKEALPVYDSFVTKSYLFMLILKKEVPAKLPASPIDVFGEVIDLCAFYGFELNIH